MLIFAPPLRKNPSPGDMKLTSLVEVSWSTEVDKKFFEKWSNIGNLVPVTKIRLTKFTMYVPLTLNIHHILN